MGDAVSPEASGNTPRSAPQPAVKEGYCNFFLPHKRRTCSFRTTPGEQFCGNHLYAATNKGPKHVPCPVDPSHTVAEHKLQQHLTRCTKLMELQHMRAQPFFCEDINAGSDEDTDLDTVTVAPLCTGGPLGSRGADGAGIACTDAVPAACAISSRSAADAVSAAPDAADTCPAARSGAEQAAADAAAADMARPAAASQVPRREVVVNPFVKGRAAYRAAFAARAGDNHLQQLVARIDAAYTDVCGGEPPRCSVLLPARCAPAMVRSDARPSQSKHLVQQASMLGNMEAKGLLPPPPGSVSVELGAGTGYLSLMLHEVWNRPVHGGTEHDAGLVGALSSSGSRDSAQSSGVQGGKGGATSVVESPPPLAGIVLMDRRGFKNKADRALRAVGGLHRVKCDLKDFDVRACPALSDAADGGRAAAHGGSGDAAAAVATPCPPWMCLGKHLCGAATDYALRCCLKPGSSATAGGDGGGGGVEAAAERTNDTTLTVLRRLRGLCIAPCCHHRCGWRAYVGKALFQRMGFSPCDFELVSWMTGWALCGHAAPAGAGAGEDEVEDDTGSDGDEKPAACERKDAANGDDRSAAQRAKRKRSSPLHKTLDVGVAAAASRHAGGFVESLSRDRRIAIGSKCKQLIDQGRLEWLRGLPGWQEAEMVQYCEPGVSGENRIIIASLQAGGMSSRE